MRSSKLSLILLMVVATSGIGPAAAQTLTDGQLRCALALQASGARVARLTIARQIHCTRGHGAFTACMAKDPGRRLARARAKTAAVAARRCSEPPPLGPIDPQAVNDGASSLLRLAPILGTTPDATLVRRRSDRAGAACQRALLREYARGTLARKDAYRRCATRLLRTLLAPTADDLRACLDADAARLARQATRGEDRVARTCGRVPLSGVVAGACRADTVGGVLACASQEARCCACLSADRADRLGAACGAIPTAASTVCAATASTEQSVARQWNEELLAAIRLDFPRPPIHARNLYHLAVAAWDAWTAYDQTASQMMHHERRTSLDPAGDRAATISFAALRVLQERFKRSPNVDTSEAAFRGRMLALGYDPDYTSTTDDRPAALGNRIAATVLAMGLTDGSNEAENYADPTYTPANEPLVVKLPGTVMADPNRWQPLALDVQIGQNGIPIPGKLQIFVGPQWLGVTPFALRPDPSSPLYLDPGPPPQLGGATDALFKERIVNVLELESQLTPDDGVRIDISPASWGNNPLGTNDGRGYPVNPATGAPYTPQLVRRGDFARVLAEFWADGPTSETPPGHWNVIANKVSDDPRLEHRIGGAGPVVDRLEWDVKLALALNGATHDAAIQCWGVKRYYDSVRPISMVRYMGGLGQSSDPSGPSYHPSGLPLVPGLIEVVTPESSAPGQRHADLAGHIGEVAVYSWPGEPPDPTTQYTGVRWMRAVDWVPFQRKTFVTPPFAAFPSGHSTYSRAAAELLTRFTGSEYFPGGLGTYEIPQNAFLKFEIGPAEPLRLEWARYYDAADQAGISRLYGGIHTSADDFQGRIAGSTIGGQAWERATALFAGSDVP